jgi:hypothetical protein
MLNIVEIGTEASRLLALLNRADVSDRFAKELKPFLKKLENAMIPGPNIYLVSADWKDTQSYHERLLQVLDGLEIPHISINVGGDSYNVAIADKPFTEAQARAEFFGGDDENEPEDDRCSQCSLLKTECVNPEHCNEELPEGLRPMNQEERDCWNGVRRLPDGSYPLIGVVTYNGEDADVVIGCDDDGNIRFTLIVPFEQFDNRMFDRVFEDRGKAQRLYVMMKAFREFGDEAEIAIYGLTKAN